MFPFVHVEGVGEGELSSEPTGEAEILTNGLILGRA
jgi:hypothetical protein